MTHYHLLLGTYTSGSSSKGIHHFRLECAPFQCREWALTPADNPSYLALDEEGEHVYATHEIGADREGWVSSYRLEAHTGMLQVISTVPTKGSDPCHVAVSPQRRFLFVSNYSSGSLAVVPCDRHGQLHDPVAVITYGGGSGAQPERQQGAHVHFAAATPDKRYLLVCDLGNDCMYRYPLLDESGDGCPLALDKVQRIELPRGSGPRQVKFSPCGRFAYVMGELDGCVYLFDYQDGDLRLRQYVLLAESWGEQEHGGGELAISSDGRFLYASNRGDFDEIAVFALDEEQGTMRRIQRLKTEGVMPRHFEITPDGGYVLVCNQGSGTLQLFDRDEHSGYLTHMQQCAFVDQPACALLLPLPH
ncbi:lactonase family protein [Zymobacter palmae]|uniref:3-carboxymuconate cyclase n=1 Tax=Zymobacter palmae TaxID=33074 RepID=A0A348HDE6_9GAMM|nr:lactonase family protein [Zymobacter palmae]BBG29648.1 3-carboxymuconate cyclase [Zymobacter palmae]